jgi:hypothetical protein
VAAQGQRIAGGFILITGLDGIRYAVRPQSVGIIHDADECRDETMIQLHGGHVFGSRARLTKFWRGSPDNQAGLDLTTSHAGLSLTLTHAIPSGFSARALILSRDDAPDQPSR